MTGSTSVELLCQSTPDRPAINVRSASAAGPVVESPKPKPGIPQPMSGRYDSNEFHPQLLRQTAPGGAKHARPYEAGCLGRLPGQSVGELSGR